MDAPVAQNAIRITVTPDASAATVEVDAACPPDTVSAESLEAAARAQGVLVDETAAAELDRIACEFRVHPHAINEVFARALPPTPPAEPTIRWDAGLDPDAENEPDATDEASVDHYAGVRFVCVQEGQRIGQAMPADPGTPGRDVLGEPIHAPPARAPERLIDAKTIAIDDGGVLTARRSGTLRAHDGTYTVDELIVIEDDIDFKVGNVETEGSLCVTGGVRDLFKIRMSKDVEIRGLVEAANIACGGTLTLGSGMAGRDHGQLDVRGNASARYLNGVIARVRGTLTVEREIVNCKLVVGERLDAPGASLIGGIAVVTGAVRVGALGSASDTPTRLILGTVPFLFAKAREIELQLGAVRAHEHALQSEIADLHDLPGLAREDKARLASLRAEAAGLAGQIDAAEADLHRLADEQAELATIDVTITKVVHSRVIFIVDGQQHVTHRPIQGPVSIFRDAAGKLVARRGSGSAMPLREVCNPQAA